ncbi:helix-turn-helix domain-containing protein [Leifsonia virtsii]|uniref:Helix-turn-helix domain-containing protein n=1 Tax=Leifsonia virtsii TaxID=3035915 RepID=A0ABT8IU26_9MICO|nr:helix-turn-helix domain-containing protein [Leifsonia virtsii]MDN4595907.1 helix-turn-helix domain-containing protein [Leifsonia virtsii]
MGETRVRQATELVIAAGGPEVIISGRAAAFLLRYAGLNQYHVDHRGEDPEIDQTLVALKVAALAWRGTATGTQEAAKPELDRGSQWLSTSQAAAAIQVTDRAIRKAIRERRLHAEKVGRTYRISREQLAHYRERRGSRA